MLQYLESHPDITAVELLTEFQARYPGFYSRAHLRTLRRRVQVWGREAIHRLIYEVKDLAPLLHHAHIVQISGESYRLKDKRKAGAMKSESKKTSRKRCRGVKFASATQRQSGSIFNRR